MSNISWCTGKDQRECGCPRSNVVSLRQIHKRKGRALIRTQNPGGASISKTKDVMFIVADLLWACDSSTTCLRHPLVTCLLSEGQ